MHGSAGWMLISFLIRSMPRSMHGWTWTPQGHGLRTHKLSSFIEFSWIECSKSHATRDSRRQQESDYCQRSIGPLKSSSFYQQGVTRFIRETFYNDISRHLERFRLQDPFFPLISCGRAKWAKWRVERWWTSFILTGDTWVYRGRHQHVLHLFLYFFKHSCQTRFLLLNNPCASKCTRSLERWKSSYSTGFVAWLTTQCVSTLTRIYVFVCATLLAVILCL